MGMAIAYISLSVVDIFAIYNEIRSVVFTSLNLERAAMVIEAFVAGGGVSIPTPMDVSRHERIFLPPESIDIEVFRTVSQTGCSMEDLHKLREVFAGEHFMVTCSEGVGPSIVLHSKATEQEVLRAMLVWGYAKVGWKEGQGSMREGATLELLKQAMAKSRSVEESFRDFLCAKGWNLKHLVFGKIKRRTDW